MDVVWQSCFFSSRRSNSESTFKPDFELVLKGVEAEAFLLRVPIADSTSDVVVDGVVDVPEIHQS